MGSWDGGQIPKPWSTVAVAIGVPLEVPSTGDDVVEAARTELERALEGLETRAREMLGS
jgi:lysophospholipid acyltransferase (LPLAT)-like uncharacterized protein